MTIRECRNHDHRDDGVWMKNRDEHCLLGTVIMLNWIDLGGGQRQILGSAYFRETNILRAIADKREIHLEAEMDEFFSSGTLLNPHVTRDFHCLYPCPSSLYDGEPYTGGVGLLAKSNFLNDWEHQPYTRMGFTVEWNANPAPGWGFGNKAILESWTGVKYGWYISGNYQGKLDKALTDTFYARCDSARYLSRKPACAVGLPTPVVVYHELAPETREAVGHIKFAFDHPLQTDPISVNKTWIPGKHGAGPALVRTADGNLNTRNRSRARAVCRAINPGYSSRGLECDEFPFASTRQGASVSQGRFSVRTIAKADNRKGGEVLQATYGDDRVLDGDSFYVKIEP